MSDLSPLGRQFGTMEDAVSAFGPLPLPGEIVVKAEFPEKLAFLFQPARYKGAWGGRGSAKSWSFARALIIRASEEPIKVLCVREMQNSMEESVHALLKFMISAMGMDHLFVIEKMHIYSTAGAIFSFEGIARNAAKIKSYEGIDICWCEEAAKITRTSWNVLIPTIRKPGSEIWLTWNPELEDDETHKRFILHPPKEAIIVNVNWQDNPWFPEVLRLEMEDLKERDFDEYLHVWEGHCKSNLQGAVYAKELRNAKLENRICKVNYEPGVPVDLWFDLGRRDTTCIWFMQRVGMQCRVIDFMEDSQEHIEYYLRAIQKKEYVFGTFYLPHDAKAKTIGAKASVESQVRSNGLRRVQIVPKLSIEDGIDAGRRFWANAYVDQDKCAEGLNHLARYRYSIKDGVLSTDPLHDEHSNAADAWRYMAVTAKPKVRKPKDETGEGEYGSSSRNPWDATIGAGLGWLSR